MLLVGETGTGKTTVCQLLALMRGQRLHVLNCNRHTETADFLGGFRPSRHREQVGFNSRGLVGFGVLGRVQAQQAQGAGEAQAMAWHHALLAVAS